MRRVLRLEEILFLIVKYSIWIKGCSKWVTKLYFKGNKKYNLLVYTEFIDIFVYCLAL